MHPYVHAAQHTEAKTQKQLKFPRTGERITMWYMDTTERCSAVKQNKTMSPEANTDALRDHRTE